MSGAQERPQLYGRGHNEALEYKDFASYLESISGYLNDPVLLASVAGKIVNVNDRAVAAYGYARDELLQLDLRDLWSPEKKDEIETRFREAEQRDGLLFETVHRRKNGTTFPVELSARINRAGGTGLIHAVVRDITQHKQAEQVLKDSERKFRELTELLPQSVFEIDEKGTLTFANRYALSSMGYSQEDFERGINALETIDPKDREKAEDNIRRLLAGEERREGEYVIHRKNGTPFSAIICSGPIVRANKRVGVRGIILDITERKRAGESLRKSEFWLEESQRAAQIGSYLINLDNKKFETTPVMDEIFGIEASHPRTVKSWLSLLHPEDREEVKVYLREKVLAEKVPFDREYRIIRPSDRQERWLHGRGELVFDEKGTPLKMVGTIQDVTERKHAEEALRRSEASYRSLIEGATYGIAIWSVEGKFLEVNPALVAMLGYDSKVELLGVDMVTHIYRRPSDRAELMAPFTQKSRFDRSAEEWKRKDGSPITVHISGRPISDENGKVTHFEAIIEDITRSHLLEEQLRQAQKMQAMGRLAGGVAHDFNNLLGVIIGYSEMMLQELNPADPIYQKIEEISKAGDRAAALTRQLLAFSRKQTLQLSSINLNEVVEEMKEMLRRMIVEDIALETLLDPDLKLAKADPGQIEQVIMNLVVNARDAMPRGGKLIVETSNVELDEHFADVHPEMQPGLYVMLAVSDTGTGMDRETQSHLFEPFFTTKEEGKGTGLGLATVYGIVKQCNGSIGVYSELGEGTTFRIYLPCSEEDVGGGTKGTKSVDELLRGNETILLVEDDDHLRRLTREILKSCGYIVLESANPQDAISFAANHKGPISVMVTDVVMPGMSGRELAEQLTLTRPAARVLYISGYTEEAITQRGVLPSGVDFLQKPFTKQTLVRKVRDLIERVET